jgi:hypothetical protein
MPLPVLRSKDFAHQSRFQLWTDALTFRQMAREAANNYLRSMSVRNAVLSAWTALEMACCDALSILKLGNDFRRSLDEEFDKKSIPRLDFGSGIWSEINSKIKTYRKLYTHFGVSIADRFPPVSVAEESIEKIRKAVHDIYGKMGKQSPAWVDFDNSSGWPSSSGGIFGTLTVSRGPLDRNDPNVYKISLITPTGDERELIWLPSDTQKEDIADEVEQLLGRLNVPFKQVRVYRGPNLFYQEELDMRGY